jgi:hypothetical protein
MLNYEGQAATGMIETHLSHRSYDNVDLDNFVFQD